MHLKVLALGFLLFGAVFAQDEGSSSSEESVESTTVQVSSTPTPVSNNPERDAFINTVYSRATVVSKHLVIHDNKVVWSPFLVVNAINALESGDEKLANGFGTAFTYLTKENPLNSTIISIGYTKNATLLAQNFTGLEMRELTTENVDSLLQETFLNVTHYHPPSQGNNVSSPKEEGQASELKKNGTVETILLTGLGVSALWATPFHPRYAKKARFYLNSTHVTKVKFMSNIGFYKFAELEDMEAEGVAVPIKYAPGTFFIFVKPKNADHIERLNERFENVSEFTETFRKFRTKRVQFSMPKLDIDSQFPIHLGNNISTLHVSSLKLSYTGAYNNFHSPAVFSRPVRFQRLRRRPDDVQLKLNSPYLFYLYDENVAGVLLSGMVLNPEEVATVSDPDSLKAPSENFKYQKEMGNLNCLKSYDETRKAAGVYDNIFVPCGSADVVYNSSLFHNGTEELFNFAFASDKLGERKFYRNEVDYVNFTFGEVVRRVKYGSFGEAFDGKVIKILNGTTSLTLFYPNERSGLAKIEEFLSHASLPEINCQLRDATLRLRLPRVSVSPFSMSVIKGSSDKDKAEQVPIERMARKSKNKSKRYRKLNIEHSFIYIVSEEALTNGGFVGAGRVTMA